MSDNLDLNNGSNAAWGARFKTALEDALGRDVPLAAAFHEARQAADQGRVEPGTPEFEQLKETITGINNWDIAANVPGAPETGGAWLRRLQPAVPYRSAMEPCRSYPLGQCGGGRRCPGQ